MTPTNNSIYMGAITILNDSALAYPVSYPGYGFDPPESGVWLEVEFFPNQGIDNGLGYNDTVIPQGNFQITCVKRPGDGIESLRPVADEIRAIYPKSTIFTERVRVIKDPWDMDDTFMPDRMKIIVTIEYSG